MRSGFPIIYEQPVFRPPGEAQSLLLQVTTGCSHNRCTFCAMYRGKSFRVRPLAEIQRELTLCADYFARRGETVRKIFLCDGDALAAPSAHLLGVLDRVHTCFPALRRIGIYATAANVRAKTDTELALLGKRKLTLAYIGLESGSDAVLRAVNKGNNAAEVVEAAQRLSQHGWQTSLIVMLGLNGRAFASAHREETAMVISQTPARLLSFLTTVAVPNTPYFRAIEAGDIQPLTSRELLEEMHYLIAHIDCPKPVIFRANHVSNQFPLEGVLSKDRAKLLSTLEQWIRSCPANLYPDANPFLL